MATLEQLPAVLDINVIQGDDLNTQFTTTENLSGYTFLAFVRQLNGSTITAVTSLVSSAGGSTIQVDFPAALTGALPIAGHRWWMEYTASTLSRTYVYGAFNVAGKI
jgi:hypothetical protein